MCMSFSSSSSSFLLILFLLYHCFTLAGLKCGWVCVRFSESEFCSYLWRKLESEAHERMKNRSIDRSKKKWYFSAFMRPIVLCGWLFRCLACLHLYYHIIVFYSIKINKFLLIIMSKMLITYSYNVAFGITFSLLWYQTNTAYMYVYCESVGIGGTFTDYNRNYGLNWNLSNENRKWNN